MELRDRKRINNIPRFNIGADSSSMFGLQFSINLPMYFSGGTGVTNNASQAISLLQQGGINKLSFMNTSAGLMNQNTFNLFMKNGNGSSNISASGGWQSFAGSAANAVGDALSLKDKFTDKTSNDIRNYGGTISKIIPGKYGLAAEGAVDLAANTVGMLNYKHTTDEMWNSAGASNRNINGIGYKTQNLADTAKSYSDVKSTGVKNAVSMGFKGSAAGLAVGGPIGAIVGGVLGNVLGIFSGRKAAIRQGRINRNAIKQTSMLNAQLLAYANSEALQTKYYQKNQDTSDDILYANRGKDLRLRKRINNKKR